MLESLLKTLAEELEIDSFPKKEETGFYHLNLNEEFLIQMQEQEAGILFLAKIGPCPQSRREDLFIHLMKANFLGQGTGNAAIGLDENENFLTLSSVLTYDMNYKMFKDALEDFANYRDYWKEELIRYAKETESNRF